MQNSNIALLKTIEAFQVLLVQYILTFVLKAYNSCALISLIDMLCIGKRGLSDTLHTTVFGYKNGGSLDRPFYPNHQSL